MITDSAAVNNFLDDFKDKPETYKQYKISIEYFFEAIGKKPDGYLVDVRLLDNRDAIRQMNIYEEDMKAYLRFLKNKTKENGKKLAGGTIHSYIGAINVFFEENRIQFDNLFMKKLKKRTPKKRRIAEDKAPTNEELSKILSFATITWKAFFMTLATSGMRIGEACRLKMEHVDFEHEPTMINLPEGVAEKDEVRITFVSDECSRYLSAWLKERDCYIAEAVQRIERLGIEKKLDDDRVFPFEAQTARKQWYKLLKKVDMDEKMEYNDIHLYHPHTLRKFFRSNFVKASIPRAIEICEGLMGHKPYLSTYVQFAEGEKEKAYKVAQKKLLIFDRMLSDDEQQAEIDIMKKQIEYLKNKMDKQEKHSKKIRDMMDSDWYVERRKSEVIYDAIEPHTGERVRVETVPDTKRLSGTELLERYDNNKKDMVDIEKMGLEKWAELKRKGKKVK